MNRGTEYIASFGIKPAENMGDFQDRIFAELGKENGSAFFRLMLENEQNDGSEYSAEKDKKYYDLKNGDYDAAVAYSLLYQGNTYRKICNWVERNRDLFGKRILDIGCDTGFVTCFLAELLPDSEIVSIDHSPRAVRNARRMAEKLQLTNIRFAEAELSDFAEDGFDTVFSSLAAISSVPGTEYRKGYFYIGQALMVAEQFGNYMKNLCGHLKTGGNLVVVERQEEDECFLGLCIAMADQGMQVLTDRHRQLVTRELGQRHRMQAIAAVKGGKTDLQALYAYHLNLVLDHLDQSAGEVFGTEAEVLLQADAKDLIKGYFLYSGSWMYGKMALYSSGKNPDRMYFFLVSGNESHLVICRAADRGDWLQTMREEVAKREKADSHFRAVEIRKDGYRETPVAVR